MDLSIPLAGMQSADAAFDSAARTVSQPFALAGPASRSDSVDLTTAVVGLLSAKLSFIANEKVASVEDNLTRNELSVLG